MPPRAGAEHSPISAIPVPTAFSMEPEASNGIVMRDGRQVFGSPSWMSHYLVSGVWGSSVGVSALAMLSPSVPGLAVIVGDGGGLRTFIDSMAATVQIWRREVMPRPVHTYLVGI